MSCQKFRNALIYDSESRSFKNGGFSVENGIFASVGNTDEGTDLGGLLVIPGLVDVHTHGRGGYDFISANDSQLAEMKELYASSGVTTVVPTLASDTLDNMLSAVARIKKAGYRAVHIEGRYLSPKRSGAHRPDLLAPLNPDEVKLFAEQADGMKLHFSSAFELDRDHAFLRAIQDVGATAGLGHTNAAYKEAVDAVAHGVRSFTHTFNCMPQIHHRDGGAVLAGLLSDAYTEIICDGLHLSAETVALVGKCKAKDKVVLITDSMEGTGCPDGEYSIAGNKVILKGGKAITESGNLAGSTLNLLEGIRNYASFSGTSFEEAVGCASINPASMLGFTDIGKTAPNYRADFLVLNPDHTLRDVYVAGEKLTKAR